jgi:hypothetical protein
MSEVAEIVVAAGGGDAAVHVAVDDDIDVDEVDFGTLQKKQKDIRLQLKKNPELNSKNLFFSGMILSKSCIEKIHFVCAPFG